MASVSSAPNGCRTVQFMNLDGKRSTIRLGKTSKRIALEVSRRIEQILSARRSNVSVDLETAKWLESISPDLTQKLAKFGLVKQIEVITLETLLDRYIAARKDVKKGTLTNYTISKNRMIAFFDPRKPVKEFHAGDADAWVIHLRTEGFAQATISRTIKHARQFFKYACRNQWANENPFVEVKAGSQSNSRRAFFVTREMAQKVFDACPNMEWRLLFALSRFGGLRCPSEHLNLTWQDIDWEKRRMLIRSPKKEHLDGGGERQVPIFPELLPFLEEAFEDCPEGERYVIRRYRGNNLNLRTQLSRIIRHAGMTPWPRLFQNLRATRETELAQQWPIHVVCTWIGNSARVASAHYLQVTESDFQEAANGALQKALQTGDDKIGQDVSESLQDEKSQTLMNKLSFDVINAQSEKVTPTGFEPDDLTLLFINSLRRLVNSSDAICAADLEKMDSVLHSLAAISPNGQKQIMECFREAIRNSVESGVEV